MDIFNVLSVPTRRGIVEVLASNGRMSAADISNRFSVSSAAVSQHLKVLRESNLVTVEKRAQQRIYQINPLALMELDLWMKRMTRTWNDRFDALEKVLEAEKLKAKRK